jgi:hypothetical protein
MNRRPLRVLSLSTPGSYLAVALGLALGLGGCLPDDPPVRGRLLYAGVDIEHPEFMELGGEPWVMFDIRRTRPVFPAGGIVDLHLVNWDTGAQRMVLPARSDRPEWARSIDREGAFLYVIDERRTSDGPGSAVGTLVRLRIQDGEILERIPDLISYTMHADRGRFHYRKYVPGAPYPELHLHEIGSNGTGKDRNLGPLSGQVQVIGPWLYYIGGGDERALTRIAGFDGEPQVLRNKVSKYLLQDGQKLGVITVSEANQVKTIVFDIDTRQEWPMPIANPCCTIQLIDHTYIFADGARGDQPAELHYFDIATKVDRVLRLPPGLLDVRSMLRRPPASRGEFLLFDQVGQTALFQTKPDFSATLTPLAPRAPGFTDDGRYLVFIDPDPAPPPPAISNLPTGRLYAQDMDRLDEAPRLLSPKGASVPLEPIGYKLRPTPEFPLLFWARYGLGGSDLYISDYETGANQKVATGIGAVHVSERHVLGVVRITQDLTGDLVYRNFETGEEKLVEHGVTDVQVARDNERMQELVAFVVRERMNSSKRNGLWATLLPDPPETPAAPDGAAPAQKIARPEGQRQRQWVRVEGGEPIEREQ